MKYKDDDDARGPRATTSLYDGKGLADLQEASRSFQGCQVKEAVVTGSKK